MRDAPAQRHHRVHRRQQLSRGHHDHERDAGGGRRQRLQPALRRFGGGGHANATPGRRQLLPGTGGAPWPVTEAEITRAPGKIPKLVNVPVEHYAHFRCQPPRGTSLRDDRPPVVRTACSSDGDVVVEAPLRLGGDIDWQIATRWHFEPSTLPPPCQTGEAAALGRRPGKNDASTGATLKPHKLPLITNDARFGKTLEASGYGWVKHG